MAWLVKELDLHQGFGSSMANPLHAWANTAPQLLLDRPSRSVSPGAVSYISDSAGGGSRRPQIARRVVGPTSPPPPLTGQGTTGTGSGSRVNSRSSTPRRGSNASSTKSGGPRDSRSPLTGSSNNRARGGSEARSTASSERSRSATRGTNVTRTGVSRPATGGGSGAAAPKSASIRQGLCTAAAKPSLTGITSKGVGWARGKTSLPASNAKSKTPGSIHRAAKPLSGGASSASSRAVRPVVSRVGIRRKGTAGNAPPPPPPRLDTSQPPSPESATKTRGAWSQSPRGEAVVAGESFNSMSLGGFDLSSNRSSITTADSFTSDDESNNRSSPRSNDDDDDEEPLMKVSGERGYGFRHEGRGAPNPEVVHDATAAVAWRRVLQFLRDSPEGN